MRELLLDAFVLCLIALALFVFVGCPIAAVRAPARSPSAPVKLEPVPEPGPQPRPCPVCPREDLIGKISLGGPIAPDGVTQVTCDLPVDQRIRNIGSRVDGAGMCVMSSIEMAARWAGLEQMRGLRDWCARQPGGGYPSKVDRQLKEFCQAKGIPIPPYIQYEGRSPEMLKLALKTGRLAALTYNGRDGVRYRGPIAHMTNLSCFTDSWCCVLDNNGIGENELIWMSPAELESRWRGNGGGWFFAWLGPGPPPIPRNL